MLKSVCSAFACRKNVDWQYKLIHMSTQKKLAVFHPHFINRESTGYPERYKQY